MILKKVVKLVAMCALGSVSVAGIAQAQNAQARQGFWFSGGLGYGSLGCDNCGSREGGVSGGLSLGGTITPRFLLGVGTSGWTKSQQGATLTVGEIDARVRFYPQTKGGFFLPRFATVGYYLAMTRRSAKRFPLQAAGVISCCGVLTPTLAQTNLPAMHVEFPVKVRHGHLDERRLHSILLITDGSHLIRAVRCFRKQGIAATACGCHYLSTTDNSGRPSEL